MDLIEHLELHCGPIVGGSNVDVDGSKAPFQVVSMLRAPVKGAAVLSTLGLSKHILHGETKQFRLELVMLHRELERPTNLPGVLQQIGADILRHHHGPLRGDVFGPRGPLRDGATVEALYVALPVYFPESFQVFRPDDGSLAINFAWLVPITREEAAFVGRAGWERFEDELVRQNPDLIDFHRPSIDLPP